MKRVFSVHLNDVLTGHLIEGDNDFITFRFDADYIKLSERPVLSQSFEEIGRAHV